MEQLNIYVVNYVLKGAGYDNARGVYDVQKSVIITASTVAKAQSAVLNLERGQRVVITSQRILGEA